MTVALDPLDAADPVVALVAPLDAVALAPAVSLALPAVPAVVPAVVFPEAVVVAALPEGA